MSDTQTNTNISTEVPAFMTQSRKLVDHLNTMMGQYEEGSSQVQSARSALEDYYKSLSGDQQEFLKQMASVEGIALGDIADLQKTFSSRFADLLGWGADVSKAVRPQIEALSEEAMEWAQLINRMTVKTCELVGELLGGMYHGTTDKFNAMSPDHLSSMRPNPYPMAA